LAAWPGKPPSCSEKPFAFAPRQNALGEHFPGMSVVEVRGLVEQRALVEIEATSVMPDDEARAESQ
jgi:hypothetical protein